MWQIAKEYGLEVKDIDMVRIEKFGHRDGRLIYEDEDIDVKEWPYIFIFLKTGGFFDIKYGYYCRFLESTSH